MKYHLIVYVFNKVDNTYVNDYIDSADNDLELSGKLAAYSIPLDFQYPSLFSVTKVIGKVPLEERRVEIHFIRLK